MYLELVAVCCDEGGGEGSEGSTVAPAALSKVEVKEYWRRCRLYAEDIEAEAVADLTVVALVGGVEGESASMKLHSATRMDPYRLEEWPPDGLEEGLLLTSESRALFKGGGCKPPEAEGVKGQTGGTHTASGSLSDRLPRLPPPTPPGPPLCPAPWPLFEKTCPPRPRLPK